MRFSEEIDALRAKGLWHLNREEFEEAERVFKKLVKTDPSPASRNNLAMCRFRQGDPEGALKVLKPNLEADLPNPFAHALAAQALAALGRQEDAQEHLARAISDFETGMKTVVPAGLVDGQSWREYTVIIKRAAGDLGHHRQVLDLYHKWERYHVHPEDCFLAGVAAFNLGRFSQAASYWRRLPRPEWGFADLYVIVADAANAGIVPRFPLEYRILDLREIKRRKTDDDLRRLAQQGWSRMIALGDILGESADHEERQLAAAQLRTIIWHGGDWGLDLAKRILSASSVGKEMKLAAAEALVDLGVYKEGESIEAVVDGKSKWLVIRTPKVTEEPDETTEALVEEARRLRDAGKIDEAIEKLQPLLGQGDFYPPAMLTLANLLRRKDRLDEAEGLLLTLKEVAPHDPTVLFNVAALYLQRGDLDRARKYAGQIDRHELTDELRGKLRLLEDEINRLALLTVRPSQVVAALADSWREEQEEKPISLNVNLSRAMRGVPAGWVNAACEEHGIDPGSIRHRRERAEALGQRLVDRRHMEETVLKLEQDEKEALRHILDRGGWAKLSALTRRFGSMDGDGFWWEEIPPRSTLGRLRRKALVFVGRAVVEGRRYKVAVIPVELREGLAELLGSPLPGARGEDSNGNDGGGADDAASGRRAPRGT